MPDLLEYRNDRKKSCFHIVAENCSPEIIYDIAPTLIRLGKVVVFSVIDCQTIETIESIRC